MACVSSGTGSTNKGVEHILEHGSRLPVPAGIFPWIKHPFQGKSLFLQGLFHDREIFFHASTQPVKYLFLGISRPHGNRFPFSPEKPPPETVKRLSPFKVIPARFHAARQGGESPYGNP
jgi:hypothetical protein